MWGVSRPFRRRPLSPTYCGNFDVLPIEIAFKIFENLNLADVGNLALTSEGMRMKVVDWMGSKRCVSRVLEPSEAFPLVIETESSTTAIATQEQTKESIWRSIQNSRFSSFAILCKRVTVLYSTKDRILFAFKVFQEALIRQESYVTSIAANANESKDWSAFCSTVKFFTLLHTFTRGWDESEFPRLLHVINKKYNISSKIDRLLLTPRFQESCLESEMKLRLITRCLTWDLAGKDYGHRASWILAVLKFLVGSDPPRQAMFFLLSFGQSCQDSDGHYEAPELMTAKQRLILSELSNHTDWDVYTSRSADDYVEAKEMFYCLAQAICSCMNSSTNWKESMLVDVLDSLFNSPSNWCDENIAGFLLFCNEQLIVFYITRKFDTGHPKDFSFAVTYTVKMILTSYKYDNRLLPDRGVGKVFDQISEHLMGSRRSKFYEDMLMCMALETEESEDMEESDGDEVFASLAFHISVRRQPDDSPARLSIFRPSHASADFSKTLKFDDADDTDYEEMEE